MTTFGKRADGKPECNWCDRSPEAHIAGSRLWNEQSSRSSLLDLVAETAEARPFPFSLLI
jgi:hypothetical protein